MYAYTYIHTYMKIFIHVYIYILIKGSLVPVYVIKNTSQSVLCMHM
jgi:hypothetical protein